MRPPTDPLYLDEADVRGELERVFDVCSGCRLCVSLCSSFPTLFEMLDSDDTHAAGDMTPAQQDAVVDTCYQCKLCAVRCPYTPDLHEWNIDVPRLMLRATAMQHDVGLTSVRSRTTSKIMGNAELVGRIGTAAAPIANSIIGAAAGSLTRKAVAKLTGVSAVRLLSPYARQRFSTWFKKRPKVTLRTPQGRVTVFPTCLVEYHDPSIGKDLVKVYERNGIECDTTAAVCCGATSLQSGDVGRFTEIAEKNVKTLAAEIRSGTAVVVAQPTCSYVLKNDYLDYVPGADAELVAEHTYDASEYLMNVHMADDTVLDTNFVGVTANRITYHAPCHLRAQDIGLASRDLMKLTGAGVKLVQQCSGVGNTWGMRSTNDEISVSMAGRLGEMIERAGGDVVAGDCHRANTAITEQTGRAARHPLQVLARAYGIAEETE